jgi:hypothetical protein
MIECEPIPNTRAPIVPNDTETSMPKLLHQLDQGICHAALGPTRLVRLRPAVSIARQIPAKPATNREGLPGAGNSITEHGT